ncbi:PREDICTED: NEDD4 family-interacting protein 2-like, partial [Merops nubicus]
MASPWQIRVAQAELCAPPAGAGCCGPRGSQGTVGGKWLHNEDDPPEPSAAEQPSTSAETTQAPQAAASPEADTSPPPYCSIAVEAAAASETHNEFYPVPPPYSVATSLPTYDEAEKAKAAAMAAAAAEVAQREEEYPPRDDFSDADQLRVGNDGIFMLAFF